MQKRGWVYLIPISIIITSLIWVPIWIHPGVVVTRDPTFYSTFREDLAQSFPAVSPLTGASNLVNGGVFYEPYMVLFWTLHVCGVSAANLSKVIPGLFTLVGILGIGYICVSMGFGPVMTVASMVVFVANPWVLDRFGYFYLWTGYLLLPWVVVGALPNLSKKGGIKWWLPIVLVFSGPLLGMFVGVILAITIILSFPGLALKVRLREMGTLILRFIVLTTFIWVPYLYQVHSHAFTSSFNHSTSGILMRVNYLTSAVLLQNPWWPHFFLGVSLPWSGLLDVALALIISFAFIEGLWHWLHARHQWLSVWLIVALVGMLLDFGFRGPLAWLFEVVDKVSGLALSEFQALFRSPAKLGGIFLLAFSVFSAAAMSELRRIWSYVVLGGICMTLAPWVMSFQQTYRPVVFPMTYDHVANHTKHGWTLDISDWAPTNVMTWSGVFEFSWNKKFAANPQYLDAFQTGPAITPASGRVNSAISTWLTENPKTIRRDVLALGISQIVIQNDIMETPGNEAQVMRLKSTLAAIPGSRIRNWDNIILIKLRTNKTSDAILQSSRSHVTVHQRWAAAGVFFLDARETGHIVHLRSPLPYSGKWISLGGTILRAGAINNAVGTRLVLRIQRRTSILIEIPVFLWAVTTAFSFLLLIIIISKNLLIAALQYRKKPRATNNASGTL